MSVKPLADRILVKIFEQEDKSSGGIILPDTAKEKPQEGKIVAVGTGRVLEDGSVRPLEVKVGDSILFAKYSGTEITQGSQEFLILKEDDILAVRTAKKR
jgi:chaperonin GroES